MNGIVLVPWERTRLWEDNPRRHFNESELRELSESIRAKGILQNLVGRPLSPEAIWNLAEPGYQIVCGQRRWRAVERLVGSGDVPAKLLIPLRVAELDDREALLLAVTENIQRRDMQPWEEAEAFGRLLDAGESVFSLAEKLAVSPRLIKRRRALLGLVPEAMLALREGRLNLGQAGAFSVGAPERQRALLDAVLDDPEFSTSRIRDKMIGGAVPMEWAIFDRALYRGPVIPDLFDDRSYAADRALFRELQTQAVQQKLEELRRIWFWAEPQWGGLFEPWTYDSDGAPGQAGAIVHLRDDLRVEIHTGLVRRQLHLAIDSARPRNVTIAEGPLSETGGPVPRGEPSPAVAGISAPSRPVSFPAAALFGAYRAKNEAIKTAIAGSPAIAMAWTICDLLRHQVNHLPDPDRAARIDPMLAELPGKLTWPPEEKRLNRHGAAIFRALVGEWMPKEVDALFAALRAVEWSRLYREEDQDLALAIAAEADLAGVPFQVNAAYLQQFALPHLVRVARQCGAAAQIEERDGDPGGLTRGELIDAILLSESRDAAWIPPEYRFLPRDQMEAELNEGVSP
jgi:ParB/RepB/Spo0J family partition protein